MGDEVMRSIAETIEAHRYEQWTVDKAAEIAQAALFALAEKGYVVVPKEVTPAMQKAYFDVIDSNLRRVETDAGFGRHDNMRLAYRAMLSASQPADR